MLWLLPWAPISSWSMRASCPMCFARGRGATSCRLHRPPSGAGLPERVVGKAGQGRNGWVGGCTLRQAQVEQMDKMRW